MELCRGKKEIKRPDDLKDPLELLEELNYITVVERETEGRGRNPSPLIKLNPKVHQINQINKIKNNKSFKSDISDTQREIKKDENGVITEGMI
jgi:hypothetical protein